MFGVYGIGKVILAFLLGILVGGYMVSHPDETVNGAATFRNYVIRVYHKIPTCSQGFTCTRNE